MGFHGHSIFLGEFGGVFFEEEEEEILGVMAVMGSRISGRGGGWEPGDS